MADDLVDNASTREEMEEWIQKLGIFLDKCSGIKLSQSSAPEIRAYAKENFPSYAVSALVLLPRNSLPQEPLRLLLEGFKKDALFNAGKKEFPVRNEAALKRYAECVASTVGELCVALIFHHSPDQTADAATSQQQLMQAARMMGVALQYVNIARDILVDANMGRVYLPADWLADEKLTPQMVLENSQGESIERLRRRLLHRAFELYHEARPAMNGLPEGSRRPMIAAVESYMEIGRVLREKGGFVVKRGRATVPKPRRIKVAVKALMSD